MDKQSLRDIGQGLLLYLRSHYYIETPNGISDGEGEVNVFKNIGNLPANSVAYIEMVNENIIKATYCSFEEYDNYLELLNTAGIKYVKYDSILKNAFSAKI